MRQSHTLNGLHSKKQVALDTVRQLNSLRLNREQAVKFNQTDAVARYDKAIAEEEVAVAYWKGRGII